MFVKAIKFSCGLLCTFAFCLPRFNGKNLMSSFSCIGFPVSWMILPLSLGNLWWTFPWRTFLPSSPSFLTNVPQIIPAENLKKCCCSTVLYVTPIKYICFVSQTGNKGASKSSSDFPMASLTVNDKMRLERGLSDFKVSSLWMVLYYVLMEPFFSNSIIGGRVRMSACEHLLTFQVVILYHLWTHWEIVARDQTVIYNCLLFYHYSSLLISWSN